MLTFREMARLILALVVIGILTSSKGASAAYISRNGGYNLVIAVDESTPLPTDFNIPNFLNYVQHIFTLFSDQLWQSTKNKFHVNSVDLIVPFDWGVEDADTATTQTYETADFKISPQFDSARVENPNPCGVTGRHVELPLDFFIRNDMDFSKYGNPVNAVLNLFARYRYGVWEEHGAIESSIFPYFYFEPSLSPVWTFTGCSADLKGSIQTGNGEETVECDVYTRPSENCRFIPALDNTVNSSLNFLQWAPGVTAFCDKDTHNHGAPNRQNLFCGHRSVWEVIRESEDFYQTVGKPLEELPPLTFRVVTNSQKPLLYILLDKGRTSASTEMLDQIIQSLEGLVNDTFLPQEIVTAVGTYPQSNFDRSHFYVKEEGEWARIQNGSATFASVIRTTLEHYDGPVVRDFGLAIQEVIEKIKVRNHNAGAIILVVKRGATQNGFEHSTYFGDVVSSINKHNLRVYAIEIQQNEKTPYVNLGGLVSFTFGKHRVINSTTDIPGVLGPFLNVIKEQLTEPLKPAVNRTWTVFKGFVPQKKEIPIPILDDNIGFLTICLTIKKHIPESAIEIRQVEGPIAHIERFRKDEWNEVADTSKRTVIIVKVHNPTKGCTFDVFINNCTSAISDDCVAFLDASVETNDQTIPSNNLDIQISTSAQNNYLDFDRSSKSSKVAPFSIFAQIESDNQRVLRLESVMATIIYENLRQWTILLQDNGDGLPDVSGNDGIYSASFTPPQNGVFKISVTVTHNQGETRFPGEVVNLLGHLIPMDQSEFGCTSSSSNRRCIAAPIFGNLTRTENMLGTVLVDNSITFSPKPMRILDFMVETLPNNMVTFGFTSPTILGIDGEKADFYHIYMGESVDEFTGGTDNLKQIVQTEGLPPGTFVTIENYDVQNSTTAFFAVESVFKTQKAGPSNVVGVRVTDDGVTPVPEPTTTTRPVSTISTTKGPIPVTTNSGPTVTPTTVFTSTESATPTTSRSPNVTTSRSPETSQSPPSTSRSKSTFPYLLVTIALGVIGIGIVIVSVYLLVTRILPRFRRNKEIAPNP